MFQYFSIMATQKVLFAFVCGLCLCGAQLYPSAAITGSLGSSAGATPTPAPTPSPACKVSFIDDIDLNGGDLPGMPVPALNNTACAQLCCLNPLCYAYSLNAGSPGNKRKCYLKAASGWDSVSIAGVQSGCKFPYANKCPKPSPPPPPPQPQPPPHRAIA